MRALAACLSVALAGSLFSTLAAPRSGLTSVAESPERPGFRFRLETPPLRTTPEADGSIALEIDGFRTRERQAGAPDIPTRIVWVAIPADVTPRLSILSVREDRRPGFRPRPVERRLWEGSEDAENAALPHAVRGVRERDAAAYAAAGRQPVAWLGATGVFRDQRYVEVHLAPVRYDPSGGGLRVATSLELEVHFDGDTGGRTEPRTDPRFESVYRDAFVNYGQGTTFRLESPTVSPSTLVPAAGPLQRIRVRQNGIVRLDSARVAGSGLETQPLSSWKLLNRGKEVPLQVNDVNSNGLLDATDWVQFYGQALDSEPKTVLHTDMPGNVADLYEASDFSDENVYFLSTEVGARSRISGRASAPTMVRVPPTSFQAVKHVETNNTWKPLGGADPWYWGPTLSNPTGGGLLSTRPDETISLPGLVSASASVRVLVGVRGVTEDAATSDHKTRVTLKNGSGGTLVTNDDNGTFDGRAVYLHDFTYASGGVTDPVRVAVQALTVSGSPGYMNQVILDSIEVRYTRTFQAAGDVLTFEVPDADSEFLVSGLSSATPEVWETTGRVAGSDVVQPVRLTGGAVSGAGPFSVRFRVDQDPAIPDGSTRRFVVFGAGAVSVPAAADFQVDTVSDLRQNGNQADFLVIAHPTVLGAASQATLNTLLAYYAGRGITSKVALLQDVEDEFGDGLSGPTAIENFLRWVMSTAPGEGWASPKPAYVLLLGDGSYDYKGGTAQGNFVPTRIFLRDDPFLGYYASDSAMAAVVGTDPMPDLLMGRIPARTDAEANTVLQKVLNYQQAPPSGPWRAHALFIADRGKRDGLGNIDVGESLAFQGIGDESEAWMKRPPHTDRKLYYYQDYCTHTPPENCTPAPMTAAIKAAVNGTDGFSDGAAIVQTASHGNFDVWSDDAFWDDRAGQPLDTNDLNNGGRLPWLIVHDCLSGGFHTPAATSLGENWLKRSGGGAVAVFAPSDLAFTPTGDLVADLIFEDLYGPRKEREIAVPLTETQVLLCGMGAIEACQAYVLLGDPATTLAIPAVGRPQNVTATGGNTRVDLAWTASSTAGAKYDVYRTSDLVHTPLAKINPSPVTALAYADTGLTNAQTYYYAVVALDAAGFESRWSHLNSDCAVSGPDCLAATPLNPNPPAAPGGLTVTDPESGGRLNLTWAANGEPDLKGYEVHYGTAPGAYTGMVSVGKVTSFSLLNLVNGTTYYVALKAVNTSNLPSAFSPEVSGRPTLVLGVRAPRFIQDLQLAKSGNDLQLTWTPVTTDIYGKPETVAQYEVFRGTTPDFVPSGANRIGTPTTASFLDVGALSAAAPRYHYLVRARDVDGLGNPGGLGNQLPAGIMGMTLSKSLTTPGNLVLSWPAVTTDFDGRPLAIHHYDVYVTNHAITRAEIRQGAVPKLVPPSPVLGTSVEITPTSPSLYYTVLAVDARGNESPF